MPHDIGAPDYIGDQKIARNILHLNQTGQRILHNLVDEFDIKEAQLRHSGKYQAAVEDSGVAVLEAYQGGLQKLGQPCKIIEGKDLPDHIGTSFYRKALYTPGTMLAQPSALVKGLADNLPPNVKLYEDTPITAVEYEPALCCITPPDALWRTSWCWRITRLARILASLSAKSFPSLPMAA